MTAALTRLTSALADRYRIERDLCEGDELKRRVVVVGDRHDQVRALHLRGLQDVVPGAVARHAHHVVVVLDEPDRVRTHGAGCVRNIAKLW